MVVARMVAPVYAAGWHLAQALWHLAYQWQVAPVDRPGAVLAGTAAAVAVILAAVLAARLGTRLWRLTPASTGPGGAPARRPRPGGVPRYTDPDAPGRARPRAPCAAPRPRTAA